MFSASFPVVGLLITSLQRAVGCHGEYVKCHCQLGAIAYNSTSRLLVRSEKKSGGSYPAANEGSFKGAQASDAHKTYGLMPTGTNYLGGGNSIYLRAMIL